MEILKEVLLKPHHVTTHNTVHYSGGSEISKPAKLKIIKYENTDGFYLLYLDDNGDELTDTYHDTLSQAVDQAKWEFEVDPDEWESVK